MIASLERVIHLAYGKEEPLLFDLFIGASSSNSHQLELKIKGERNSKKKKKTRVIKSDELWLRIE